MAWVTQEFRYKEFVVLLQGSDVEISDLEEDVSISFAPDKQVDAHAWAMMLRRCARRLEEIGKGLE